MIFSWKKLFRSVSYDCLLFETKSVGRVAQGIMEPLSSSDPPASTFWVARSMGMCSCSHLFIFVVTAVLYIIKHKAFLWPVVGCSFFFNYHVFVYLLACLPVRHRQVISVIDSVEVCWFSCGWRFVHDRPFRNLYSWKCTAASAHLMLLRCDWCLGVEGSLGLMVWSMQGKSVKSCSPVTWGPAEAPCSWNSVLSFLT